MEAAANDKGRKPRLIHAIRTVAQQYLVHYWYRNERCGITLAASPGQSPHELDIAIDIEQNAQRRYVLRNYGWRWRGPTDPGHFTYIGGCLDARLKEENIRAFQRLWNRNNPADLIDEDGIYGDQETGPRLLLSPVAGW